MVELVIKIPEEDYKKLVYMDIFRLRRYIENGVVLPNGHGDLVDYDEMKNNAREYGAYEEATLSHIKPKTIIEADEAESEEKR